MKTKILTSLALASLMSLYFAGCSSEPRSVEELRKLYSKEELKKMHEEKCDGKKENEQDRECANIAQAYLFYPIGEK